MKRLFYPILVILAALSPFLHAPAQPPAINDFPGWPQQFEGDELTTLPLSERETYFAADFPGKIGRFNAGEREIVVRWVATASRKLHPAADCFQGAGYTVSPLPIRRDHQGAQWGCFSAERQRKSLRICERIYDERGGSWSDTSSWFWDALRGKSSGPWWAVTVAEG